MAQSLNKTVLLNTTGTSYLSIAGKVGKFLVGDQALEFYPDVNVEQFIQIPWDHINQIGANVTGRKISRHFEVFTDRGKIPLCFKKTQVPFSKLLVKNWAMTRSSSFQL